MMDQLRIASYINGLVGHDYNQIGTLRERGLKFLVSYVYPFAPHFYTAKTRVMDVYILFLFIDPKQRSRVLVRGVSYVCP